MRIINFSAGPCQLSSHVLETASRDMIDYKQTGMSVCELTHISDEWKNSWKDLEKNSLLNRRL